MVISCLDAAEVSKNQAFGSVWKEESVRADLGFMEYEPEDAKMLNSAGLSCDQK